jgi:predicted NAD-dependent protein-ADP-ribosyltransferase YbiA (DUF1768 family)/ubiquitin C-terminal hydrolase
MSNIKMIKLMNPNDVPFGMLSNHSTHNMIIDGEEYKTVTNYIYSNMLTTPIYKNVIRNMTINYSSSNANKNLLKTIDFLIKSYENESSVSSINVSTPIKFMGKKRNDTDDADDNDEEEKDQNDEDKIQEYLKEFEESKMDEELERKKLIKRNEEIVAKEIGLPFKELNLKTLRRQIEEESIIVRMKIQEAYLSYHTKEIENVIKKALEKGFLSLFEDLELAEILLQTGNVPIKYESSDTMMGTGENGNGLNLVGKVLEQIRHIFQMNRKEKMESKKNERMYTIYRAYLILVDMMLNGQKNILEYENLNADAIFAKYSADKEKRDVKIPVKERFHKDVESSFIVLSPVVLNALNNEKNLVRGVYRENVRTLREKQLSKKDDLIFQTYLEHMVVRNFENLEADKIETAIQQQLKKLSETEIKHLKDRIVKLNNAGTFSDSLKEKIQVAFKKLSIISDEEILRIENEPVQLNDEYEVEEDEEEEEEEEDEKRKVISLEDAFREGKIKEKKKAKPKQVTNDKIVKLVSQLVNISGTPTIAYANMSLSQLQKELKRIQNFDLNVEHKEDEFYRIPAGHGLVIYKENTGKNLNAFLPLCPDFFIRMLKIDALSFPTVEHFVLSSLISSYTGKTRTVDEEGHTVIKQGISIKDARDKILSSSGQEVVRQVDHRSLRPEDFTTIEHAQYVFMNEKRISDEFQLSFLANRALNTKFENEDMQNLLLTTEDAQLLWISPDNLFLGAGNEVQQGNNYVGKVLMKLRADILQTRQTKSVYKRTYSIKYMFDYLESDEVLKQWVKKRILEMCDLVSKFERLLGFKLSDKDYVEFVEIVVNSIYKKITPLSSTTKSTQLLTAPTFVKYIIKGCEGMDFSGDAMFFEDNIKELLAQNEELVKQKKLVSSGKEEEKAFRDVQKSDLDEYKESIAHLPEVKRKKDFDAFVKNQRAEYEEYVSSIGRQAKELESQIQANKDYIEELKRKHKDQEKNSAKNLNSVSDIYWTKLVLIAEDNVKNSKLSKDEIRLSIVRTYLPSFQRCKTIVQNPRLNCAVSAVLNILEGVKALKIKFAEKFDENELDEFDVETAVSILTKTDIPDDLKTTKFLKKKMVRKAKFGAGDYSDAEDSEDETEVAPEAELEVAEEDEDTVDVPYNGLPNPVEDNEGEDNIIFKTSPEFEQQNENPDHPLINGFCVIKNQRNQCYMNACIQLLFSISSLRKSLKELDMSTIKNTDGYLIIGALKAVFETFEQNLGSDTVIDFEDIKFQGKTVYKILLGELKAGRQEDPTEFLYRTLLSKFQSLHQNEVVKNLLETLSCKENSVVECEKGIVRTKEIVSIEDFSLGLFLTIDFNKPEKTMEDVINHHQEYEVIQGGKSELCKSDTNPNGLFKRKKLQVELLPTTEYLIVNLVRNRFVKGKNVKITEPIRNFNVINVDGTRFLLVGCVIHIGKSPSKGHYVYSVFKKGRVVFTLDDDEKTHDISETDIAKNGFLFLYKKMPSDFTSEDYEETDINNIRNELQLIDSDLDSEKAERLANIIFQKVQALDSNQGKLRRSLVNFFATKN